MTREAFVPIFVVILLVVQGSTGGGMVMGEGHSKADIGQQTQTADAGVTADFELVSVASNVPVDGTGNLSLTFENTGADITNARIAVQSPNESVRFGDSQNASKSVGNWSSGERRTVTYRLLAEEFAEVRSYPFEAVISYTTRNGSRERAGPYTFNVRPTQPIRLERFEVTDISSNVQAGDTGTVSLTLENTGRDVSDAVISLQSQNDQLRLGESRNASQFVSEWATDEDVQVEYQVSASNDTVGGSYPFSISVSYREDGSRNQTQSQLIGIIPAPEQSFSLTDVNSTLRVGDEGVVTGQVTNEGPQAAANAVLVLQSQGDNAFPRETEYALETLESGESERVRYRIDVSEGADRGPRQFSFVVRYENQDGDSRQSKPLETAVRVGPQRDEFVIEPQSASVEQGSSSTISLVVTNNGDRTLRNIDARTFVDSPLTLEEDQAFITRLEPNESATIAFSLSAEGEALAGTYPMSVDFQYETPDGESQLSDTYEVPVRVAEPDGNGLLSFLSGGIVLPLILVLGVVLVGVGGFVAFRRWRAARGSRRRRGDGGG
ncbi:COG1361 S-layer family protein [Haladaptatus cibarius]|uniref:COG1361 S-layer family protein n=1 Tax=Haladaptatus cibarius TaxID=453847 RepID=UPI000679A14B|nr:COG1361 S-layer family protein [Haladaptatus cibarius]